MFGTPVVTTAPLTQKHCDALEAIYWSTGGPGWTYDWMPQRQRSTDPCTWTGVWCDSRRGIYRLELSYNNLVGAVPGEIGDLENLEWLSIYSNSLTSLPVQIGNLDKLVRLQASNNNFSTVPGQIGSLVALEFLALSNNQLTVLPASVANLANLRHLLVSGNQLTALPNMSNLTELYELAADHNLIAAAPVFNNPKLNTVYLDHNQLGGAISGVVNNLVSQPQLERVGLGHNNLSGHMPPAVAQMPLVYMELSGNGCITADAATTTFLGTLASFTGTADDGLNVGCPTLILTPEIVATPAVEIPGPTPLLGSTVQRPILMGR